MNRHIMIAATLAALAATSTHSAGQDLMASARLSPQKDGVAVAVHISSSDLRVETSDKLRWSYSLLKRNRVFGAAMVGLADTPATYYSTPFQVRAPFEVDGPLHLIVYAVRLDDESGAVERLFGTRVHDLELSELFLLYQQAAYLATRRREAVEGGRALYAKDVQVFFKFLEISRELGRHANLAVSEEAKKVKLLLRNALTNERGKRAIDAAIPGKSQDVRFLLDQVDAVQAEQLKAVFQRIKKAEDAGAGVAACEKYQAFKETLQWDVDTVAIARWEKDYQFNTNLSAALARCAGLVRQTGTNPDGTLTDDARAQISLLWPLEISSLPPKALSAVSRHKATVRGMAGSPP